MINSTPIHHFLKEIDIYYPSKSTNNHIAKNKPDIFYSSKSFQRQTPRHRECISTCYIRIEFYTNLETPTKTLKLTNPIQLAPSNRSRRKITFYIITVYCTQPHNKRCQTSTLFIIFHCPT